VTRSSREQFSFLKFSKDFTIAAQLRALEPSVKGLDRSRLMQQCASRAVAGRR
jgi:hypothetical protein